MTIQQDGHWGREGEVESYEAGQDWGWCDAGGGWGERGAEGCRERALSHQADMQVCVLQRDGIFQNVALSVYQPYLAAPFPRRRLVVLARHLEMRVDRQSVV